MEDKREKEFFDMKKGIRFAALSLAASLIFTLPQNTLSVDAAVNPPLKTVESSNVPTKYTGLKLSIWETACLPSMIIFQGIITSSIRATAVYPW